MRAAIAGFLETWATPSAVLDAEEGALEAAIRPCGLQANRVAALKTMSLDFLATDWAEPSEFKGCGKFTADSFRIFCRGHRDGGAVEDATLKRYLTWVNRGAGGGGEARRGRKKAAAAGRRRKGVAKKQRGGHGARRSARLTAAM